jgi:2-desacetyl-2-hydroxyethyl bacteriochlorophyllide A dehydrogenase
MRAQRIRFVGPRAVAIEPVGVDDPQPGEVLVRTEYSGISGGTEMLAYRGAIDPSTPLDEALGTLAGTFAYPFSYGYSCVGLVERSRGAIGEGERVFAFHPHQDAFAVSVGETIPLASTDPRSATLLPLVETALQVSLDAGPRIGEAVAVIGLGPVGIITGALLHRAGADVIGSDPDPFRRETAQAFGVRPVDPVDLRPTVEGATGGRGIGIAVEASGDPAALADALSLLAHEGVALVCSWYGAKPASLPLGAEFHRRRLSIRSTQVSTIPAALQATWDVGRRRGVARQLLEELPVKLLATHEFPFHDAALAFDALDRGEAGLIHAALKYR